MTASQREYLEKICQDIYHLPLPSQQDKADYLAYLLGQMLPMEPDGTMKQEGSRLVKHHAKIKSVAKKYDCLPANPRKIKALANRLGVVLRHNEQASLPCIPDAPNDERVYPLLLATAIIYTCHRELNEQLEKSPDYINTLLLFAQNPGATDKNLLGPMKNIQPSFDGTQKLPTNPSDSNVFRLHDLLCDLQSVTPSELQPFLGI